MDKYKISIIVPVYNVEKYINKCIDSIINQTYKNLEILLIDDGSTDNSGKICDEYAKKDKRIIVFHQNNSGVSVARNKGLDNITGDYIMFVDSDDWIELNTCEILINEIKQTNNDLIFFNTIKEYEKYKIKSNYFLKTINNKELKFKIQAKILAPTMKFNEVNGNEFGLACNKIISKKIIKNQRFEFESQKAIFEDGIFYYILLEQNIKIGMINENLYHYRIISTSATKSFNKDIMDISNKIIEIIDSKKLNHKEDVYYNESFAIRKLINLTHILSMNINNNNKKDSVINRIKKIKKEAMQKKYLDIYKDIKTKNLGKKLKIYYYLFRYKLYLLLIVTNTFESKIKRMTIGG